MKIRFSKKIIKKKSIINILFIFLVVGKLVQKVPVYEVLLQIGN